MNENKICIQVIQELKALKSIGIKIPNKAFALNRIRPFFKNFIGGSKDLSGMIDSYLLLI